MLIYEQFIYVLYLDLVVYISSVMDKFWFIDRFFDWILIDWLLKALAVLSDTTVRRSAVDREDLKPC